MQRISQFNLTVGAILGRLDLFLLLAVALAVLVGGVGIANTMLAPSSRIGSPSGAGWFSLADSPFHSGCSARP